ncbi:MULTISPECIES: co-chaperone GroES [Aerococcus]|uniref:Co-chaperonin GroES n=1 Tax=Aerococcus sanguinicola TaxID=119206 RepID=A0A5N1GPD5_9LACT|nr:MULTISPECIES: co-chaperone GroES [Aerococcus]KAA9300570.1 co-chaperone GroES [Aerococcus sanguinicola]MDK6369630.1 co-chaperone GroES [Aerococcus sp. UMB9870]MDK6680135.1 co-chaperone GroES [Aerococcus sp. UMB8608]MDK6686296.1 co-chaperone GroES [Aerococcus sp. UMB8623]MDK6940216.1 co-chaperone GroES [Aerococcus sp. UMB8487]
MLKPLNERVIVQIEEQEEKTTSGILLPSAAQEKSQVGRVIAVADETEDFTSPVKKDDLVLFEKYAGNEVEYAGEKYLILKAKDIVAIIED